MAEQRLILCGPGVPAAPGRAWAGVPALSLELGKRRGDVHLDISRITRRMGENLPPEVTDLLEIAAYVYVADQAVRRGGSKEFEYGQRWRRHFRFEVPVRQPRVWCNRRVTGALQETLSFLSGDDYEFRFRQHENPPRLESYLFDGVGNDSGTDFEEVLLFSGGLDSLGGAVEEVLVGKRRVVLVSHRPVNHVYRRQCDLVQGLRDVLVGGRPSPLHVAVEVNKGRPYDRDVAQRARSFLFAAVAAMVARLCGLRRIRFYENGVTSLNLPPTPAVVGSRASRTTHPRVLTGFRHLFSALFQTDFAVENLAQWQTKAEILSRIKAARAGHLCATARSCAHTREGTVSQPHCGRCSQCVERRVTALAAGLDEREDPPGGYVSEVFMGERTGPELTFIERYVATLRRVGRLPDTMTLLERFPEAVFALGYLDMPRADAAAAIRGLYQRHAQQFTDAVRTATERASTALASRAVPPHSLLGVSLGLSDSPLRAAGEVRPPAGPSVLVVDAETFTARWGNDVCPLGNTKEFALLAYLHERHGRFVSYERLCDGVWNDPHTAKNTIQRTVSNLRRRLRQCSFAGVCVDGNEKGHYRLLVQPPGPTASA